MGLQKFWQNNKVLIVMGTSLGLIHWGWYHLQSSSVLHKAKEEYIPEPGIVTYVLNSSAAAAPAAPTAPATPAAPKSK